MNLSPKQCPCGCSKVILDPVCGCQCSSVQPEVAHELAVKLKYHDELMAALEGLVADPTVQARRDARNLTRKIRKELLERPDFPRFYFDRRG